MIQHFKANTVPSFMTSRPTWNILASKIKEKKDAQSLKRVSICTFQSGIQLNCVYTIAAFEFYTSGHPEYIE